MAKTVYNEETIELQDGTEVTLRPLPLGLLKKFMKAFSKFQDMENPDDGFDVYVQCVGIALSREVKDRFDATLTKDGALESEYQEWVEDVVDMETVLRIMDKCADVKLDDPKVLEEAEKAARAAQQ